MVDWLIKDALIIDGMGLPRFPGDIAISDDRILDVGNLGDLDATHLIAARKRVAAPGFIDMHSHSDVLYLNGSSPTHKIFQGVTTELIGQDGISTAPVTESSKPYIAEMIEPLAGHLKDPWRPWDVEDFLRELDEKKPPLNVMTLVGHSNLRLAVMGYRMGLPSSRELRAMGELLARGLGHGAMGLSLGLIYPPCSYSETEELICLGNVVRDHDAILVAHIRNEQDGVFQALDEMITVGRESGCRIHISHLKCMGKQNWGSMPRVLEILENALNQGVDIGFDQYPYEASCTSLSILVPGWAMEGGWEAFDRRLEDSPVRKRILAALRASIESRGGPASVTIASAQSQKNQELTGKNLDQIARDRGIPGEEAALEILKDEKLQALAIYHAMSREDVERALAHPLQTVGSDGILGEFPHPRAYGAFPRVIRHFCRERKLFPLEEAIRKMTSAPAKRLNLESRGRITRGAYADLILFDPENFRDNATFDDPKRLASGLDWVFINGKAVVKKGTLQEIGPGRIISQQES
jgi:N-acyl-D-amino-acid deacylase